MNHNPEEWKSIKGYEGLYEVSTYGRVRSIDRIVTYENGRKHFHKNKVLTTDKDKRLGYIRVTLSKNGKTKKFPIHCLVLETFGNPRQTYQECRHFPDPNPNNNHISNLKWGTRKENEADKIIHGTYNHIGEKNPAAKLTNKEALLISKDQRPSRKLAKIYNVSKSTILRIKSQQAWRHIYGT